MISDVPALLSWNEIRSRLDEFVFEFEGESREHAEYATFWDQLLASYGITRRRVATFQQQATRASTGNTGFIDFFWPKVVIGEHKSLGKMGAEDEVAEAQAFDYLAGGDISPEDFPRYIISTDYAHMRVTDLEAHGGAKSTFFPLTDIRKHAEELGFLGGYQAVSIDTTAQEAASVRAAKVMANLYAALTGDADQDYDDAGVEDEDDEDETVHRTAVLLTRLLFLMFGDDAGLWQRGLFLNWMRDRTAPDGSDLGAKLAELFQVLNTRKRPDRMDESLKKFPYVNGGVFSAADELGILAFDQDMRDALISACLFDWSDISPAVFGSLFQAVKSKEARRLDGEHYTTETNILKTLNPLFLDDYRARVRASWNNAKKLHDIHDELATNTYCDPAAGCSNFLVIAYRELRDIELGIIMRLRELEGDQTSQMLDVSLGLRVSLDQFTGIEINWWPAKIAETAMFLVDHQANLRMAASLGQAPDRLPITIAANIVHANALTTDWATVIPAVKGHTFVFGNPPFLGDHTRDKQQKAELQAAWGGSKTLSRLDYVTAWHAKTLAFFRARANRGEWAFVTTSSITQGDQPARLFAPIHDDGWRIKFAHRTFAWTSEAPGAAAVHCVIIGFTKSRTGKPRLFEYATVKGEPQEISPKVGINAYLLDQPWVLVESRSTPLSKDIEKVARGHMATDDGNFIVTDEDLEVVRSDSVASKYLRPYVGARELLRDTHRWCLWLKDVEPDDLAKSSILQARVEAVKAFRIANDKPETTRSYPHHHLFRQFGPEAESYLAIPAVVSETRRYYPAARLNKSIPSNKVYVTADDDGFQFAVFSSSMFVAWQKAIGGRMKSDLNFAQTVTWYTFPLPSVSADDRVRIIDAGNLVLSSRAKHPTRTLVEHYNPLAMDPDLVKAHDVLDRAVDRVFGQKSRVVDEASRQRILIEAYLAATGKSTLDIPAEEPPAPRTNLAAVRAWAAAHGYSVGARGRIPAEVREAYDIAAATL